MKTFKIIGIILLIFIGLPLLISLFLPSKVHVERSRVIEAPVDVIFNQVNNLKKWRNWSPWLSIDPNMKINYKGPESGKGASYSWVSDDKQVGNGRLSILKSVPHDTIIIEMDFMENGKSKGSYFFQEQDKGVKVTWTMDSDMGLNPIGRWFGLFMDKMVGPDFENGLANLEKVAKLESKASTLSQPLKIESISVASTPVLTIRRKSTPAEISRTLGQSYIEILTFIRMNNLKQTGPPFAIYHTYSDLEVDMEPGIPVEKLPVQTAGNIKASKMAKGKAVVADFYGPSEQTGKAHQEIEKWIKANNKKVMGSPWEVYVTDPGVEPDTSKWLTKIYYPIF